MDLARPLDLPLQVHRIAAAELEPHFRIEEEILLPAVMLAEGTHLAQRTLEDHLALRREVAAIQDGEALAVGRFADRLTKHVRFEERELLPWCEAHLPDAVLEEAKRRSGEASSETTSFRRGVGPR